MEYLEAIKKFGEIEKKYDVMAIRYKGISVWPYLRIYLFDTIVTRKAVDHSSSALLLVLRSLFKFNPIKFFKHYKVWSYSASITRKKIGENYEHHVSGYLHKSGYSVLTVEFSSPGTREIKREAMPERNIVSSSWSILLAAVIDVLTRPFPIGIEKEDLLHEIIAELGVNFNYKMRIRRLLAQKWARDIILAIGYNPELVILECYYTNMGNIWSFHNHKIPVVEMQHGVVNKNHNAYNSRFHSEELYPDELCVYGEEEYNYFVNKKPPFAKKITQTGMYMLDQAGKYFTKDIFERQRKVYDKIIVVAGETVIEDKMSLFIDEVAKRCLNCYFVYIPRRKAEYHFSSPNVKYIFGVNIYEYLKWCDILVTHASTTGIEAHYFRKPVMFYDFDGIAKEYYGNIINQKNGAFYVHSLDEFIKTIMNIDVQKYSFRELFAHNSERRMAKVLSSYLEN